MSVTHGTFEASPIIATECRSVDLLSAICGGLCSGMAKIEEQGTLKGRHGGRDW